ncbi:MAG: tetratricopeptide repeat protein [Deltaproteobacteria bacterium]|nr:tetratricopeptide repeat protein [Deltaproteobacteria bacterium]
MTPQELEELRAGALDHVNAGRMDEALAAFEAIAAHDPQAADGWINLAAAERGMGRLHLAAEHFRRGVEILRQAGFEDKGLLATALHALGTTLEALELTDEAAAAYRESASNDPRAPTPLAALATLLARAGHLREADKVATEYCMAAVSILAEKSNIPLVRKFQKALKDAAAIDGNRVLIATREAYARGFEEAVAKLPEGVRTEAEPLTRDEQGNPVAVLANPSRPFSRVRFDAVHPGTGERWMIHDAPTYGFPADCPAAVDGFFSVTHPAGTPFPVLLCTRTAWDYFFIRLRFVNGLREQTIERAEAILGGWYLKGETGGFGAGGKGYFHFIGEPFPIGQVGLRYEVDLGLAQIDAVPALFDALKQLHQQEPIEIAVLGDGALPLKG